MNKITETSISKDQKKVQKKSILIYFDYEKSVIRNADTSERAMRAQLQQINNQEQKQLIVCYAWKLTFMKQWYDVHNQKMLAIIKTLKRWRIYLLKTKYQTIIKSDHKNLQYFMITKKLNEWQAWWAETLTKYDFTIQYCKEKDNSWTDILSNRSDFIKKEIKQKKQAMLQTNKKEQLKYIHC